MRGIDVRRERRSDLARHAGAAWHSAYRYFPWEDWRAGEDEQTSGWMRATAPAGDASFEGVVSWSGELGYGVRSPEPAQDVRDRVDD